MVLLFDPDNVGSGGGGVAIALTFGRDPASEIARRRAASSSLVVSGKGNEASEFCRSCAAIYIYYRTINIQKKDTKRSLVELIF